MKKYSIVESIKKIRKPSIAPTRFIPNKKKSKLEAISKREMSNY